MKIDGEDDQVKSGVGTFCSLILLLITGVYAYQKLIIFIDKKDISIMLSTVDLFFTDDDLFTYEQGMNIAVGFSGYDSQTEWALDKSYGDLVFNSYSWGNDENGNPFSKREPLDTHICSRENLGLEGPTENAQFFEPHPGSRAFIELYQKKFLCADPKQMFIQGDFNTNKAR